jgi:hypothetical protein
MCSLCGRHAASSGCVACEPRWAGDSRADGDRWRLGGWRYRPGGDTRWRPGDGCWWGIRYAMQCCAESLPEELRGWLGVGGGGGWTICFADELFLFLLHHWRFCHTVPTLSGARTKGFFGNSVPSSHCLGACVHSLSFRLQQAHLPQPFRQPPV